MALGLIGAQKSFLWGRLEPTNTKLPPSREGLTIPLRSPFSYLVITLTPAEFFCEVYLHTDWSHSRLCFWQSFFVAQTRRGRSVLFLFMSVWCAVNSKTHAAPNSSRPPLRFVLDSRECLLCPTQIGAPGVSIDGHSELQVHQKSALRNLGCLQLVPLSLPRLNVSTCVSVTAWPLHTQVRVHVQTSKHNVQKFRSRGDLMISKWAVHFDTKSLRSFHCTQF